ncbi:substrate-binding domain-containing protein [Cupriavidus basilensis]
MRRTCLNWTRRASRKTRGALYAVGRIVLFVPNNAAIKPDVELNDVRAASADGRLTKFSIANPEHAPYGRAAREALTALGMWEVLAPEAGVGRERLPGGSVCSLRLGAGRAYSRCHSPFHQISRGPVRM